MGVVCLQKLATLLPLLPALLNASLSAERKEKGKDCISSLPSELAALEYEV